MSAPSVTMADAVRLYRIGNNAAVGYAPYTDEPGADAIDAAVEAVGAEGWEVVLPRRNSDEVVVLRDGGGALLAIGGDAMGRNAWAVDLDRAREVDAKIQADFAREVGGA